MSFANFGTENWTQFNQQQPNVELTIEDHHFVPFSLNWYGYELWAFVNAPLHVHGTSTASVASAGFESASEGFTAGSFDMSLPTQRELIVGKSAKGCKK